MALNLTSRCVRKKMLPAKPTLPLLTVCCITARDHRAFSSLKLIPKVNAACGTFVCFRMLSDKRTLVRKETVTGTSSEKALRQYDKERNYFKKALQTGASKESFLAAVERFKDDDKYRRKHLKFVRTAMEYVDSFELQEDVDVYNAIMDVFPRNKFNTKRFFETVWAKPHPQAHLALELLTKMEENGVRPKYDTYALCLEIFGKGSLPVRKCIRLAYWLEVFRNMNPYSLPDSVYKEKINVCKAALQRIHLGDEDKTSTYFCEEDEGSGEKKFIIGSIMKYQEDTIEKLHPDVPLFVEGPITMWINRAQEHYYVLRTDKDHSLKPHDEDFNKYYWQDYSEGIVLAMCMTNRKTPEALLEWIGALEKEMALLKNFRIIFNLTNASDESEESYNPQILEPRKELPGVAKNL